MTKTIFSPYEPSSYDLALVGAPREMIGDKDKLVRESRHAIYLALGGVPCGMSRDRK